MNPYLTIAQDRFSNPFLFNLYCVVADRQTQDPFNRLFTHKMPPAQLIGVFEYASKLCSDAPPEDMLEACKALLSVFEDKNFRSDYVTARVLVTHYENIMGDEQRTRSSMCESAYAQAESRIIAPPESHIDHLTDEQAIKMEQITVQDNSTLSHLHTVRVINSQTL